ncbi:MAG: iron-sulfur cluster repair di-iron protein [Bacteroidetes bacterium]|nr:iron-sulfur cluster repair di-iron protein [Bacteroidota bacterium]
MTNLSQQTLASIVSENHHAVPVFEKYNLDFCCKGKRALADACGEKGLELDKIIQELESAATKEKDKGIPFDEMEPAQLINYIIINHHYYTKKMMPLIWSHLEKVSFKHGDRFPYMNEVFHLFTGLKDEMYEHMQKEELVLFPRIVEIERSYSNNNYGALPDKYVTDPIRIMEMEHEHAGDIMWKIKALTDNYTAPDSACATFRVSMAELKEFENDLHQHVHLENNILFPKVKSLVAPPENLLMT